MAQYNFYSMANVAAAFTECMGVPRPEQAQQPALPLVQFYKNAFGGENADRVVIYNPDAIAMWLYMKYTADFLPVTRHTQLALPLHTVMPSVTPVCFGTMYTGVMPAVHGIRKYEKPVIRVDSVFDAMIRAGKKCAIVSQTGASMSRIYLEKDMDYFTDFESDEEVVEKGIELINSKKYDFISVYNGYYDHVMHGAQVEAHESLAVMRNECALFDKIACAAKESYRNENTFLGFCTDHGCHDNGNNRGTHGTALPDDLNVVHFFGAQPREQA